MQHARPIGPTGVNAAAPFGPEMVQGHQPARFRETLGNQRSVTVAQTTPQAAPLSPEMGQGAAPDRPTHYLQGPLFMQPPAQPTLVNAPFSVEMTLASRPWSPILGKPAPLGWQWWTSDLANYSVEQGQGSHPDAPRLFLAPRFQQPPSQTTQTDAAFTSSMTQGWQPPSPLLGKPAPTGWVWFTPDVAVFSIEEVVGSHPDSPRLFLPPRFPQTPSQLTQTDAPFSAEMTAGRIPPRAILDKPAPLGWFIWTPDIIPFSIEEVVGWHPDAPRPFTAPRFQQPPFPITPIPTPFSAEMVQGSQVPPFRLWPNVARFVVLPLPITAPAQPTFAGRWAPHGYVMHVLEQGTGSYVAQLVAEDGVTPLPGSLLTSLQLTLYTIAQDDSIVIVNGRNQQMILNANGGIVAPSGLITWFYGVGDTTLVDPTVPFERHIALFEYAWAGGGAGKVEVILVVHNLHRVG